MASLLEKFVVVFAAGHSLRRAVLGGQHPRHEGQQFVQGVKMGRLTRQHMLDPTNQLPLSDYRRRVQLHHKGALYRQRSVGGRVGRYRSSCNVMLGLTTRLTRTLGRPKARSL
jgi:hypothetical protein